MKIMGRKSSSNVQKVLWCCAELGVKYEHENAGREFGIIDTDEFLELNPNGKVPVLIYKGINLWESNTIVRMVAARFGSGTMFPKEIKSQAIATQWMDWQLSTLGPDFTAMFHGLVRDKPEDRNWKSIDSSIRKTQANLEILDRYLSETQFIAGDTLTMGDIPVGIYVYRWYEFKTIKRKTLPNLERWYSDLRKRPAFQEFVMVGLG
ncbi:MAG: glutathione S-transferase [Rhodospirillaceae bacterium]|nr:glutathione S-transferase [Rhodospirillaceae bacterium]